MNQAHLNKGNFYISSDGVLKCIFNNTTITGVKALQNGTIKFTSKN